MTNFITFCACLLVLPLTLLSWFFVLQVLLGITSKKEVYPAKKSQPGKMAVLIPAHNEAAVISDTLLSLSLANVDPGNILVVADNCDDNTAKIARTHKVHVIERTNNLERGKGYALAEGISHLSDTPPDYLFILDADCVITPGSIELLKFRSAMKRVVQSQYLIKAPSGSGINRRAAEFFFLIKSCIRPTGLSRMNISMLLGGSGMLFPWKTISDLKIATSEITEDTKLGLDIQLSGHQILFEPNAEVVSYFPRSDSALDAQSQRWTQGNLRLAFFYSPKLIHAAFTRKELGLFLSALNLLIPPISLLLVLLFLSSSLGVVALYIDGNSVALVISIINFGGIAFATLASWLSHGRHILSATDFLKLPLQLVAKIPRYARILRFKRIGWVKTERDQ